jgi:hypothetical protein
MTLSAQGMAVIRFAMDVLLIVILMQTYYLNLVTKDVSKINRRNFFSPVRKLKVNGFEYIKKNKT